MQLEEKQRSCQIKYTGRIFTVTSDEVELPDRRTARRDVVHHSGGVAIVAVKENGDAVFVTQYRYCQSEAVLEIVAGTREAGEDPLETAKRELAEEAGLGARHWKHLSTFYPTPGYSSERDEIYLATGLYSSRAEQDDDEFLSVSTMPLAQAVRKVFDGEIPDGKTQTGLLLAARALGILRQEDDYVGKTGNQG